MTQPTDSGLRPCPFCKSDALRLEQTSPLHFSVNCNSCGSQIHRITEAEAISAWNTRPSAPDDEAVKLAIEKKAWIEGCVTGLCRSTGFMHKYKAELEAEEVWKQWKENPK